MLLQEDSCQRHPEKSPSHSGSRNVWQGETFREIQGGCRQRSQHHQSVQVTHCHCHGDVDVDYCSSGNMFGVRNTWEKLCRGGRTKKKILTLVLLRERFSHSGVCLTRVLGEKWPVKIQIEWIIFQAAVWGGEQQLHHLGLDVPPQSAVQEVEEGEREAEHGAGHDEVHTQGAVGSRNLLTWGK